MVLVCKGDEIYRKSIYEKLNAMSKQEMFIHIMGFWLMTEIFASLFPNKALRIHSLYLNDDFLLFLFRCFGSPDVPLD